MRRFTTAAARQGGFGSLRVEARGLCLRGRRRAHFEDRCRPDPTPLAAEPRRQGQVLVPLLRRGRRASGSGGPRGEPGPVLRLGGPVGPLPGAALRRRQGEPGPGAYSRFIVLLGWRPHLHGGVERVPARRARLGGARRLFVARLRAQLRGGARERRLRGARGRVRPRGRAAPAGACVRAAGTTRGRRFEAVSLRRSVVVGRRAAAGHLRRARGAGVGGAVAIAAPGEAGLAAAEAGAPALAVAVAVDLAVAADARV